MSNLDEELDKVTISQELNESTANNILDEQNIISDEEVEERINGIFSDNEIPHSDLVDKRSEYDCGIKLDDLKAMSEYMQGLRDRPVFIDKFTSNDSQRLKDANTVISMYGLNMIPTWYAYNNLIMSEIYKPERLAIMETKDLISLSNGLLKNINLVQQNASQVLQSTGYGENSEARKMVDKITSMSNEKYARLKEFINNEDLI